MLPLIRKNPALATGILLPVLLVILFSIAALVPKIFVDPPRFDLIFSLKSFSSHGDFEYKASVENGQLKLQTRKVPASSGGGGYHYRLFWYEAATRHVHELELPEPKNSGTQWVNLPMKETEGWKISPELTAPDGYQLHNDYKRTSDLGLLFFSGTQRSAIHIVKYSRIVSIFPPKPDRVINTPEFIGWVEERAVAP